MLTSSDVISDMRVNVREEGDDKVVWYKVVEGAKALASDSHHS